MAVAVYGRTGVGKTYTLFHHLSSLPRRYPLLIRSLEEVYKVTQGAYTDIIFDDISFELTRPELLIHLCDKEFHATIRILRRAIEVPAKIRKWFTHNNKEAFIPVLATLEQQAAIDRRLHVFHVDSREEVIDIIEQFK